MKFKAGQIFVTRNPMLLGKVINGVQRFWSADDSSEYSHAGIIIDQYGSTFESLWTIRHSHLSEYTGKKILIGELVGVSENAIKNAIYSVIDDHRGQIYPFWRLPLHIIPPLAKYLSLSRHPVCSELTFKFIKLAGIGNVGRWCGKTPDHVADFIEHDDQCSIVFKGEMEELPLVC